MSDNGFRAKVTKLLDLPANSDDATISAAVEKRIDEQDERIVASAVAQGRVLEADRGFWCTALRSDRQNARRVLASMTAPPTGPAAATEPNRSPYTAVDDPLTGATIDGNPGIPAASTVSEYQLTSLTEHLEVAGEHGRRQFMRGNRLTGVAQSEVDRLVRSGDAVHVGKLDRRDWQF